MISKAVELAIGEGFDPRELRTLKDETLSVILRQRYAGNAPICSSVEAWSRGSSIKPCYVLTVDIGEERRRQSWTGFTSIARSAKRAEHRRRRRQASSRIRSLFIVRRLGCRCRKPKFRFGWRAECLPLSGSNNEEIRILKEKHKALWKFFVLIDRVGVGEERRTWPGEAEDRWLNALK